VTGDIRAVLHRNVFFSFSFMKSSFVNKHIRRIAKSLDFKEGTKQYKVVPPFLF